jgi:hypothetical protein
MKKPSPLNIGVALIFMVVALVFLADLVGFLKANDIFGKYWPGLLILVGIVIAGSPGKPSRTGLALGLMILGLLLILRTLGVLNSQAGETILVVLLALSGLAILVMNVGNEPKPTDKNKSIDN